MSSEKRSSKAQVKRSIQAQVDSTVKSTGKTLGQNDSKAMAKVHSLRSNKAKTKFSTKVQSSKDSTKPRPNQIEHIDQRLKSRSTLHSNEYLHIVIAAGHSNSLAMAFLADGSFLGLADADYGITTHLQAPDTISHNIIELLDKLAVDCKLETTELSIEARFVSISCPGAASRMDQDIVNLVCKTLLPNANVLILDDTWAGLYAGSPEFQGTCAFAGTGASVFVGCGTIPKDWEGKIDGWGSVIGDFGSSFQISVNMFRAFCREWNRSGAAPQLYLDLCTFITNWNRSGRQPHLPILNPNNLASAQILFDSITRFDSLKSWRVVFAKLAQVAIDAADRDRSDPLARSLVDQAASEMIESLEIAGKRLPESIKWPVYFHGGLFERSKRYLKKVQQGLISQNRDPGVLCNWRPVLGTAFASFNRNQLLSERSAKEKVNLLLRGLDSNQSRHLIRGKG